ncbi:MAG: ABC-type glycerol-3-phosphate transport system, permease component [Chloroflexi bacterium AL-W]|nr:ABC-type glycerol-3-phosphate transport system, permease component [Chloroflexi bacterium AL-N1]NOK70449.1 ABC-type glycerol-3-phosphate transport system, permease component [Chloroflexi bacterium AL-N10]NOK78192.1 ABC-type glycerol-3-phosphate transport system, permease component [Chloroflexi bacterium AL-N5]NOK85291.1 ABC-type glycerol-3-phosphate transport system, permease component [Chloroflexi bacterium AL-W]NOK92056.1 ABC-type glycerol-3-phosphate transport system, permease component [
MAVTTYQSSKRTQQLVRLTMTYILMMILACFFLFPIVFMLISSFKADEAQVLRDMSGLAAFIPYGTISLENYQDVFVRIAFGRYLYNSLVIVTITVVFGLFFNSLAAYALARIPFVGRRLMLAVVIALIIIPFQAIAVPLLLLVNQFPWFDGSRSWIDSYHVQIIPFWADAFSIFLFYQFFIGIPKELEEAALVDGASRFRMYWQLVVPLSRPIFATVAILKFLQYWGEFLWPLMVTRGDDFRPLTVGMQVLFGQAPLRWGDIMAYASMVTIPVLIVFLLFQKWFIQSVASSGVKG